MLVASPLRRWNPSWSEGSVLAELPHYTQPFSSEAILDLFHPKILDSTRAAFLPGTLSGSSVTLVFGPKTRLFPSNREPFPLRTASDPSVKKTFGDLATIGIPPTQVSKNNPTPISPHLETFLSSPIPPLTQVCQQSRLPELHFFHSDRDRAAQLTATDTTHQTRPLLNHGIASRPTSFPNPQPSILIPIPKPVQNRPWLLLGIDWLTFIER